MQTLYEVSLVNSRFGLGTVQNHPYPPADLFYESAVSRQGTDKQCRIFVGRVSVGSTTGAEKHKTQKENHKPEQAEVRA